MLNERKIVGSPPAKVLAASKRRRFIVRQIRSPARSQGRSPRVGVERRLLNRDECAFRSGVGTTLFDAMVRDGRMPKPTHRINSRVLWDIRKIDAAIDALDISDWDDDPWGDMRE